MNNNLYFIRLLLFYLLATANINNNAAFNCGCKVVRRCYSTMVKDLIRYDEASCISDAAIGASTVTIFLKALYEYCPDLIEVYSDKLTNEERHLFEVMVRTPPVHPKDDERPIFIIDAGQEAGTESVGFALYLIEQLVSCQENNQMITKVRWVILPSTNPDGQEYARFNRFHWRKNTKPSDDGFSFGVDISRNFEGDWTSCPKIQSGYSSIYPGVAPASENETIFIQKVLNKYVKNTRLYLSIRRDGHSISYPLASTFSSPVSRPQLERVARLVAARVNQRAGGIHLFTNKSIYELNGESRCGHSVDYAYQFMNITYSLEMRVFLGSENRLLKKFQTLPRGYETTLRNGYYSGIRELYNFITKVKHF